MSIQPKAYLLTAPHWGIPAGTGVFQSMVHDFGVSNDDTRNFGHGVADYKSISLKPDRGYPTYTVPEADLREITWAEAEQMFRAAEAMGAERPKPVPTLGGMPVGISEPIYDQCSALLAKGTVLLTVNLKTLDDAHGLLRWMYSSNKPLTAELREIAWDKAVVSKKEADALQVLKQALLP